MKARFFAALATCAVLALGLAAIGCGSSNNDNSSSTSSTGSAELTATPDINVPVDQTIADAVPADIKSSGTLTIAADATYPPNESIAKDGKTVIGMDADLAKAIGEVMGLDTSVQNVTFDAIIPGLAAGKYDLGMSSFTDNKEREATVDFVDYLTAGTSIFAKADGGPDVTSLDQLCGHSVAVEKGTTQQKAAEDQNKKCGVDVQVFPDQNAANLAVKSGKAELGMADSPVVDFFVAQSDGDLKVTGGPFPPEPYGIAIPKGNGMAQPVLDAVNALIADGTYTKILDYWGLTSGAIDKATLNGAVS